MSEATLAVRLAEAEAMVVQLIGREWFDRVIVERVYLWALSRHVRRLIRCEMVNHREPRNCRCTMWISSDDERTREKAAAPVTLGVPE